MGSVKRCRPSPLLEYAHSATTRSSLAAARPSSLIRFPSKFSGPTRAPFSVIRFGCGAPGSATFVNLTAPAVREITLNGEPVGLDAFDGDQITVEGLAADNVLRISAECAYSRSGEGLHRFTDPADSNVYLYSDLETFDAHRIYACFDQPDMKASYELTVRAPQAWYIVSNMAPDKRCNGRETDRCAKNIAANTAASVPPISTTSRTL